MAVQNVTDTQTVTYVCKLTKCSLHVNREMAQWEKTFAVQYEDTMSSNPQSSGKKLDT